MKSVITTMLTIFFIMVSVFAISTFEQANISYENAKEYHADVVSQVEASNFAWTVEQELINQAADNGYLLEINDVSYRNKQNGYVRSNAKVAEVILTYKYDLPMFGVHRTREIRGYAR